MQPIITEFQAVIPSGISSSSRGSTQERIAVSARLELVQGKMKTRWVLEHTGVGAHR